MKLHQGCPSFGCSFSLDFAQSSLNTADFLPFLSHADGHRPRKPASKPASARLVGAPQVFCFILTIFLFISYSPAFALDLPTKPPSVRGLPDGVVEDEAAFDGKGLDDTQGTGTTIWHSLAARSTSPLSHVMTMPKPFDTNIQGNSLSTDCRNFFTDFLSNSDVTHCHAISMLLENSNSFFHDLTSAAKVSAILDTSCSAPHHQCFETMTNLAIKLLSEATCGEDYRNGSQLVVTAFTSMIAYEPVYNASCLMNQDTGNYCFVDAATNADNPDDYSVYFLPLGTYYTSTSRPTCSRCLQASMAIFSQWAEVRGQRLVQSYIPSAQRVNEVCGHDFVDANVSVAIKTSITGVAGRNRPSLLLSYAFGMTLVVLMFKFL